MGKREEKIPSGPYCYTFDMKAISDADRVDPLNLPIIKCPFWKWVEDGNNSFATCKFLYTKEQQEQEREFGDTINTILLDDDCKVCNVNQEFTKKDENNWKLIENKKL